MKDTILFIALYGTVGLIGKFTGALWFVLCDSFAAGRRSAYQLQDRIGQKVSKPLPTECAHGVVYWAPCKQCDDEDRAGA